MARKRYKPVKRPAKSAPESNLPGYDPDGHFDDSPARLNRLAKKMVGRTVGAEVELPELNPDGSMKGGEDSGDEEE